MPSRNRDEKGNFVSSPPTLLEDNSHLIVQFTYGNPIANVYEYVCDTIEAALCPLTKWKRVDLSQKQQKKLLSLHTYSFLLGSHWGRFYGFMKSWKAPMGSWNNVL